MICFYSSGKLKPRTSRVQSWFVEGRSSILGRITSAGRLLITTVFVLVLCVRSIFHAPKYSGLLIAFSCLCIKALLQSSHNEEDVSGAPMEPESSTYSHLSFYQISPVPNVLAIVRYTAYNPEDGTLMAVGEEMIFDTPDEFAKMEDDVLEALLAGVDVALLSSYEPDFFPQINQIIEDSPETLDEE